MYTNVSMSMLLDILNGTRLVPSTSYATKVSIYEDRVKMYYTSPSDYGISGSGFRLGSTNNIAGWAFSTTQLSSSTYASGGSGEYKYNVKLISSPTIAGVHVQLDEDIVGNPAYLSFGSILNSAGTAQDRYGISFIESAGTYFELSNTIRQIAGWNFDIVKLWNGAIVLSTSASAYLGSAGTGFEVYNPPSPKIIIGNKVGQKIDWNITNANSLTIGGTIGSSLTTNAQGEASGTVSTYASIYKSGSGDYPVLAANYYIGAGNNTSFFVSPANGTTVMSWERLLTAGVGANATFKLNYTIANSSGSWELLINDKKLTRTHARGTITPVGDLKQGDTWYNSATGMWSIYDTSDGWVTIPNV